MKITSSKNIKTTVNTETLALINTVLDDELKKVSKPSRKLSDNNFEASYICATFSSIVRKDKSLFKIEENYNSNGYLVTCETDYKPSIFFWIFFAIELLLIVIGLFTDNMQSSTTDFTTGIGLIVGLYFYNKYLVENTIRNILDNVANKFE